MWSPLIRENAQWQTRRRISNRVVRPITVHSKVASKATADRAVNPVNPARVDKLASRRTLTPTRRIPQPAARRIRKKKTRIATVSVAPRRPASIRTNTVPASLPGLFYSRQFPPHFLSTQTKLRQTSDAAMTFPAQPPNSLVMHSGEPEQNRHPLPVCSARAMCLRLSGSVRIFTRL